jgi:transposase
VGASRRQYTREFKVEAVRLATAGEKSLTAVAREFGVRPDLLREWKYQFGGALRVSEAVPGQGGALTAEEEIARLRREVEQLKQEREFLKKAAAYFAREQP